VAEIKCKECGLPVQGIDYKDKYVQCPHCGAVFAND